MSEFVYLFHNEPPSGTPEQIQQAMQRWLAWRKDLTDNGHFKDGRPLERRGKFATGRQKIVTDGSHAETKELVGGYMLIEANDLQQAVELSLGCPILEGGGTVEVRPVMKFL
jgi:hypothetical protein